MIRGKSHDTKARSERGALARLLQGQRERAGYSRARLGELLEISPGTIEGWELGRVVRPPAHEVIRLAAFLKTSYGELLEAVTTDLGGMPRGPDDSSDGARKTRPEKPRGAIPLLEASFRLFRWKDEDDAAAALNVSPNQVRRWRQGSDPIDVVDYLSMTAMVNIVIAAAMQSGETSDLDLVRASESLGLRIADV